MELIRARRRHRSGGRAREPNLRAVGRVPVAVLVELLAGEPQAGDGDHEHEEGDAADEGQATGLGIEDLEIPTVNELFIHTQPAHLQKLRREQLQSAERNVARAAYLRMRLAGPRVPG